MIYLPSPSTIQEPVMDRRPRPSSSPTKSSKSPMYTYETNGQNRNADMPLNDKERQLAELQRQLKEILAERNDLKIRLKTVEDEVEELKKTSSNNETSTKKLQGKNAMLENDRTTLQVRLRKVEAEIINLAKQNEDRREEIRRLDEKLQKVENKNEELEVEVKWLKKAVAPNDSEQTVALLYLGELCCQIQSSMYEKILPDYFHSWRNYKVETIEKDIKSVLKYKRERVEAAKNLQELKTSLNWNTGLEDAVKSLQDSRNSTAHPNDLIDEASLRKYAKALHDQGQLKGHPSLEQVNELIDIWLRLK